MARVIPKYRKGKDQPYAYNIRVFRGKDENGKELKPYQMTWEVPTGLKDAKRIKNALDKVVGEFETDCKRGNISADNRTLSEYIRYFMELSERDKKVRSLDYYASLLPRIEQELGYIRINQLTVKDLNKFYLKLQKEDVRKDKKAVAKEKLIRLKAEQHITHKRLALLAGLSDNTVRLMCQRKRVSLESAMKASDALRCPLKEVFDIVSAPATENERGLSAKTIRGYHNFLHNVLDFARREGVIVRNPADSAVPPQVKRKEAEFFDVEEIIRIREALKNEPLKYRIMLYLLIETGMRKGELCGLCWNKVDFGEGIIRIDNNIQWSKERGLYEDTPKHDEIRELNISDEVMGYLWKYKIMEDEFADARSANGTEYNSRGYLFHQECGDKPIFPSSLNIWMAKVEKKYGLPHLYPHKFRHSQASILYANNVDVVTISNRLGHAQISTTQNIYSHLLKKSDKKASNAIAESIWKK